MVGIVMPRRQDGDMNNQGNPAPSYGDDKSGAEPPGRTALISALWRGERPLWETFWWYAVVFGTLANLITTLAFFFLASKDVNYALSFAAYALPVPYNVFVLIAVWRSAGNYQGPEIQAHLARAAITIWCVAASLS
jgi:hypothetical protein